MTLLAVLLTIPATTLTAMLLASLHDAIRGF